MNQKIDNKNTLFLIDGSSFLYRAYHSLRPLHTISGTPVNAVYGFCRMIQKLIKQFDPHYFAIVWDSRGKTVRHELYSAYKATRQEPPSDLFMQKELIQEFARTAHIAQISKEAVEADDLLYSAALDAAHAGHPVILVTSDKDMYQLLTNPLITIFDPFKDGIIDKEAYEAQLGFPVDRLTLYYALLGDASDNIPGVEGIGKKGATELAQQFVSLKDLYERSDQITKQATRTKLVAQKENAFLSEQLFRLQYIAGNYNPEQYRYDRASWLDTLPFFKKVQFKSLIEEIEKIVPESRTISFDLDKKYQFIMVTTLDHLKQVIDEICTAKVCAVDTELNGLSPLQATLVGMCLATQPGTAYYIPFGHTTGEQQLARDVVLAHCKGWLEDSAIKKIMHHAKFDMLALAHYGIITSGLVDDTLIAGALVTKDWQRAGLKYLSELYLQETMLNFKQMVTDQGLRTFDQVPIQQATAYAAADAHQTLRLQPILEEEIKKQEMETLYKTIEMPVVNVLFDMEREGICVDVDMLKKYSAIAQEKLQEIRNDIIALIGEQWSTINLNSPKQLAELLFEYLKLPTQKKTAGKTGYSTDQEVLEQLATMHPVPQLIILYRELFKLQSTYLDALPLAVNKETGKIHTNFNQTAVETGRLASSEPNMQNIPTTSRVCPEITIRAAFTPRPGHLFISADYSQIELRVLGYLSQDPALIKAFLHNEDIHTTTAAHLFGVARELVSGEQRQLGKRINFSVLYGMTPYGLAQDLGIPFGQAKKYIDRYFEQFNGVATWMKTVIEETKEKGYVTTLFGRRRYIPGIYERNKPLYEAACRVVINTKAQGTAAELMKIGMLRVHELANQLKPQAHIILQIHDELLISVPQEHAHAFETAVKKALEGVVQWNIPLVVQSRTGVNWHEVSK